MKTDPTHESPDLIDRRDPFDPSRFDPRPGEPAVRPGVLLPTMLDSGWTIAPDGSLVPPPEAPPAAPSPAVEVPEQTITASPPSLSTAINLQLAPIFLVAAAAVLFIRAATRRGRR